MELSASTDLEDGPLQRDDHKTIPSWAWHGLRDAISNNWELLNKFRSTCPLQIWYIDGGRTISM